MKTGGLVFAIQRGKGENWILSSQTTEEKQVAASDSFTVKKFTLLIMSHKQIYYSDKYDDEKFEYRHVMLPKDLAKLVPKTHLMSETEWRNLGVQQSQGWVHYMTHQPEPHILLFRRPLPPTL
ncbi:cyclin-dependent kinases regulatory subunit 1 [Clupea harengus]|uniref:Cyclin-dependent kinases regulatory subunit n=1 Tax=Clupea harengus TaxID=7950 RepID=A0A8M1KK28_CLUHA|nr:cyclin-dependent kinases regulatory subunit 1 [Clupea harengus]